MCLLMSLFLGIGCADKAKPPEKDLVQRPVAEGREMGLFDKLFKIERKQNILLCAVILTDEDFRFLVEFNTHDANIKNDEYVRLVLHYYAKILFNFDPNDVQMAGAAKVLKSMMDAILTARIGKDSNILKLGNIDDVAKMVSSPPKNVPRKIVAKLYSSADNQRVITTDIPVNAYAQHMVFSVVALLHAIVGILDEPSISILNTSVKYMNMSYKSGVSHSDIHNLIKIPNEAYFASKSE